MPPIDNDNEILDSIFQNSVCRLFSNVESLSTSYVSIYFWTGILIEVLTDRKIIVCNKILFDKNLQIYYHQN